MTRFLMTTALVALTASPALAEQHSAMVLVIDSQYQTEENMNISTENLMGKTVYIAGEDANPDMDWTNITDVPDGWQDVADVSNIMIDKDGNVNSIVLDAGGFLGMGETEKSVSIENLKFVADKDDEGEYFVVYTGNKELLAESDDYDEAAMMGQGYRSANAENTDLTAQVGDANTEVTPAEPMNRETMVEASLANMTTDRLDGTAIYGANNERIGEIGNMILGEDGRIAEVIVDVGGFLGIGERHVAVALDSIALMQDEGGTVVGYVSMTEEQIEALEEYDDKS